MKPKIQTYILIGYFIFGFILNSCTLIVFFLSAYLNGKTYHGNDGHNNGIVVLCFSIPLWVILILITRKRNNKEAFIGYCINAIINLIFYSTIALTEFYS